jgi:predicted enzyme related to lactoylglutathione lyase
MRIVSLAVLLLCQACLSPAGDKRVPSKPAQIFYLEIVTRDVAAVCAAYEAAHGTHFGGPDAGLGGARTAALLGGGLVGVRAPLRETEQPIVRPYWLVDDIEAAVAAAVAAGGEVAHPPLEIPGHGKFAIYFEGGVEHGLWQR